MVRTMCVFVPILNRSPLTRAFPLECGMLCMVFFLCAPAHPLETRRATIDGGGATSIGGGFSVRGTIGQPDATEIVPASGTFSLRGGFWTIRVIQTPGAPLLSLASEPPGSVTLSWTPDTPGFVLQETSSLTNTNWVNSPSGNANPTVVPLGEARRFYRLFKP